MNIFCRSACRAFLLFIALGALWSTAFAQTPQRPPNIVLIVSDDQGYRDLGCCGSPDIKSPHLDALAARGVRLTDYYVTWPACTPSRGSILTGRYPQRNGLYDMIRNDMVNYGHKFTEVEYALSPEMTLGMDLREVMISQPLAQAGYACGVFGKWDGGRARRFLPLQRGFDTYFGFANTGIDYWTHERYGVPSMFRGNQRVKEEGYATDLFRREALRFVRDNLHRPFFLYLPFNAPHGASNLEHSGVQAPQEYISMYPNAKNEKQATHMAAITCMDAAIGEVLQAIKAAGQEDNTIVIFQSDNGGAGPGDNSPLRGNKGQMFDGGIRVPCIVSWPGRLPQGAVSHELLTSLELFPTLLAVAGVQPPKDVTLDGFNMLPTLRGEVKSPRKEMFWQRRLDKAARVGNYKWLVSGNNTGLFDLSTDIGEQHDLSQEKPEILAQVQARFAAWENEMEAAEPRGPFRDY